jgi:hypothetical protein
MSFEKQNPNSYESLKRASDGSLVPTSELKAYEKNLKQEDKKETRNTKHDEEKIDRGRRRFLHGVAGATGVALGFTLGKHLIQEGPEGIAVRIRDYLNAIDNFGEREPIHLTPIEQFTKFGKIKNLHSAIETIHDCHYEHITNTGVGKRDMQEATENLSKLDMNRFTEPFKDADIPQQFAYMIAIQETRGRVETSWAGARGIMGIMPDTARSFGYQPEAVDDPYIASEVAAKYIEEERTRFGDDVDMLLHSYNGGGSLFYFADSTSKTERTAENFYLYMEAYMNARHDEAREQGYVEVTIQKGDTLSEIARDWSVSLSEIFNLNAMNEKTVLHVGKEVMVPYNDSEDFLKRFFRSELEVLQYAPEVKAKYEALKDDGLLAQIESDLDERTSHFG